MNTQEMTLNLQAYVDGELTTAQRAELEKYLAKDANAQTLVTGLKQLSALLKEGEPIAKVPDTREFYWSQIQRRIAAQEKAQARSTEPARTAARWLRWLVPSLGVAVAAVVISRQYGPTQAPIASIEGSQTEASSVVFRSESDGVTIHWIN